MKKLTLSVPTMYADHHVLEVRSALAKLNGVVQIEASAAAKRVTVDYDGELSPGDVEQALAKTGYSPNQEPSLPELPKRSEDGSAWYGLIHRTTETEMKDLEMSGDFRRY